MADPDRTPGSEFAKRMIQPSQHNIQILPVCGGYLVQVGCRTFVYSDVLTLADDLKDYLLAPENFTKEFLASDEGFRPMPAEAPMNVNAVGGFGGGASFGRLQR